MSDYREPPPIDEAKVLQGLIKEVETKADKYALMKAEQDALNARIERSFKGKDIGVPKADPVAVALWAKQMVGLEQELEKAKARIKELETELFTWRGCPACHTDHGPSSMCQPSEVLQARSERAMSQYDLWKARGRAAILQAQEAKAEITRLKETVGKSESLRMQELEAERHSLRSCTERINQDRMEDIAMFDKESAELERARDDAEAERNREIERASRMGAELSQQWADRCKAEAERDAARAEAAELHLSVEQMLDWFTVENVGLFEAVYGELDETDVLNKAKACVGNTNLAAEHLVRDRKRDEALRKISKQACDCGLFSQHEVSCPTSIAREALKER